MVSPAAIFERVRSPRVALFANLGLVMTGSVLALVSYFDLLTGVIVVSIGLLGMYVSLLGYRDE